MNGTISIILNMLCGKICSSLIQIGDNTKQISILSPELCPASLEAPEEERKLKCFCRGVMRRTKGYSVFLLLSLNVRHPINPDLVEALAIAGGMFL